MNEVVVRIARVRGERDSDLPLPSLATQGSAGMDLRAGVDADLVLAPGQREAVPTGLAIALPRGFEAQVRSRSGLALRFGITLPNAPGTIDSDYRGEIHVILHNGGDADFVVKRGDRIAQLVVAPVVGVKWDEVEDREALGETRRADGGFGHSGRD